MDQELIAYLGDRFREVQEQFAASRKETKQQFVASREETNRQFAVSREETNQRFERLEEKVRYNGVEIEGLRDEIRQVAEGVSVANERSDAFERRFTTKLNDAQTEMRILVRGVVERDSGARAPEAKALVKTRQKGKGRPPS